MGETDPRTELFREALQGLKDVQYRNRQEQARGNAEVLGEIARIAREAGLPEEEVTALVSDGLRRITTDLTSPPRRKERRDRRRSEEAELMEGEAVEESLALPSPTSAEGL